MSQRSVASTLLWTILQVVCLLTNDCHGFLHPAVQLQQQNHCHQTQQQTNIFVPSTTLTLTSFNDVGAFCGAQNWRQGKTNTGRQQHPCLRRQRRSVSTVQTMGLFGLGAAELLVIAAVGAFIVGPEKLGSMVGSLKGGLDDGLAEDLKRIPEEFQKGVEQGEATARARNAKKMEPVPEDEGNDTTKDE